MKRSAKCKCVHCSELFLPDFRNRGRQRHCAKPECRKVARRSSQHRWLAKAENQNYFRGPENSARVREWRARHPGCQTQSYLRLTRPSLRTAPRTCPDAPATAATSAADLRQRRATFPSIRGGVQSPGSPKVPHSGLAGRRRRSKPEAPAIGCSVEAERKASLRIERIASTYEPVSPARTMMFAPLSARDHMRARMLFIADRPGAGRSKSRFRSSVARYHAFAQPLCLA
jgi:hypothetical protein